MKTSKKLLICSATAGELQGSNYIRNHIVSPLEEGNTYELPCHTNLLITGVGMFASGYRIAKALMSGEYGFVILAGVAGSYNPQCELGKAYIGCSWSFADCATENPDGSMQPVVGSVFLRADSAPFADAWIESPAARKLSEDMGIESARINTVNRIDTSARHIEEITRLFPAQLETMESAAAAYTCAMEHIPFAEIRCVSNHTVPKNSEKWQIKKAVEKLGGLIDQLLSDKNKLLSEYL